MIPSVLMNMDFAATPSDAPEPEPSIDVGHLLLLGVGRMVVPFILLLRAIGVLRDAS